MNRKLLATITSLVAVGFIVDAAQGTTYYNIGGNWSDASNWKTACSGGAAGAVPGCGDTAVICANCTVDSNACCAGVTVNTGAVLTIPAGVTLDLHGNSSVADVGGLVIDSASVGGAGKLKISASLTVSGNGSVRGTLSSGSAQPLIQLTSGVTLTNSAIFEGVLTIQDTGLVLSQTHFVNSGTVRANSNGTLDIHPDLLDACSGSWEASTDSTPAVLQFSAGNASLTGSFTVADGAKLRIMSNVTVSTSGSLTYSGANSVIRVESGGAFNTNQ